MIRKPASVTLILLMTILFMCDDVKASTDSAKSGIAEATRETIEQLEHELNGAILSRDKAALNRLLAHDFTSGGNRILMKTEHIDMIVSVIPPKTQTIDSMSVRLYEDTAVVTGLATGEWLSPAGAEKKSFRWVNVWVRGTSGWRTVLGLRHGHGAGDLHVGLGDLRMGDSFCTVRTSHPGRFRPIIK